MTDDPFDGRDDEPSFQAVPAVRQAVPGLFAFWGNSDSGKTYSALRFARGLVGPTGKIAVIDTENKRALFYAGKFGGWLHIDLQPPFTPQRYRAAQDAAIRAGADCIITDSESHVWEGEGGVLDQADANDAKGLAKWKTPKMAYKRLRNAQLRSPVHMIFCLRAKEKFTQTGSGKNAEIASAGDVPIADKRFIFEMTVAVHMESGTRKPLGPVKAPDDIAGIIAPGEFVTEEMGNRIAQWLASGAEVDHELEAMKTLARDKATEGTVALRDWWAATITKAMKPRISSIIPELQDIARLADEESARQASEAFQNANDGANPLDDPFTPKSAVA